jgi:hypothetical protein
VKLWDRRTNETPKAYEAFKVYLELGDSRGIPKVSEQCSKNRSQLFRWVARHDWVERARLWDSMNAEEERRTFQKDKETMIRRHASMAGAGSSSRDGRSWHVWRHVIRG